MGTDVQTDSIEPRQPLPDSGSRSSRWRPVVEVVLIASVLALFTRTFLVQAYRIPSPSMEPTLLVGDHLLMNKFVFGTGAGRLGRLLPQRDVRPGDLVSFRGTEDPRHEMLKRCIATAGQQVQLEAKELFVDGRRIDESAYVTHVDERIYPPSEYLHQSYRRRDSWGPEPVPPGGLFCLGDNRDVSRDSRFFGAVATNAVRGRPLFVYWSRDRERGRWAIRWRRTLHLPR